MKQIAIIGVGMAGLAAAAQLKKSGFDITLFEKAAESVVALLPAESMVCNLTTARSISQPKALVSAKRSRNGVWLAELTNGLKVLSLGRPQ